MPTNHGINFINGDFLQIKLNSVFNQQTDKRGLMKLVQTNCLF